MRRFFYLLDLLLLASPLYTGSAVGSQRIELSTCALIRRVLGTTQLRDEPIFVDIVKRGRLSYMYVYLRRTRRGHSHRLPGPLLLPVRVSSLQADLVRTRPARAKRLPHPQAPRDPVC